MSNSYREHHQTVRPKVWTAEVIVVFVIAFIVLPCLSHFL